MITQRLMVTLRILSVHSSHIKKLNWSDFYFLWKNQRLGLKNHVCVKQSRYQTKWERASRVSRVSGSKPRFTDPHQMKKILIIKRRFNQKFEISTNNINKIIMKIFYKESKKFSSLTYLVHPKKNTTPSRFDSSIVLNIKFLWPEKSFSWSFFSVYTT